MGPAPLLLLPLLTSLLGASSENCRLVTGYGVKQPQHLEAPEGGSVRIPFSFYHPWELAENPAVNILWRWQNFHGDFIYNHTQNQTHKKFKDRLLLEWTKGQAQGALLIRKLRRGDATTYFCRVWLNTKRCGTWIFQSIQGTKLTVTPAQHKAGLDMTDSTRSTGTPGLDAVVAVTATIVTNNTQSAGPPGLDAVVAVTATIATNNTQSTGPPGLDAVVAVTVIIALLKVTILGLVSYLVWKRRQG